MLAGILISAAIAVTRLQAQASDERLARAAATDADALRFFAVLPMGAVLVGPNDEILASNALAERLRVVRGTRVAPTEVLDAVRAARRSGERAEIAVEDRLPGQPTVELGAQVVPLDQGRVAVLAVDRAAEERAQASSRDFMSNATHELKTPIGAISLLSEAIEDASDDPDAVTRFAGKIRAESERLGSLVQQIITLSRLQGVPVGEGESVAVDRIVHEVMGRCRTLADARGVSLADSGQAGLCAFGDAVQLSTAVENLVLNAITYSDEGARVVVTKRDASVDGTPWVEIAVSDNGIGIAESDQQRIFERFYRVDYARTRARGGTGLGLSIVSEIAASHHGAVSVWSKPGAGSTFTLKVPGVTSPAKEGQA